MARVHFAYDNADLMKLLASRGSYLKQGNAKKISEIEDVIKKSIDDKRD